LAQAIGYLSPANQQEVKDQSHDHDKREFSQVDVQARLVRLNACRHSTLDRVAGTVRKGGGQKLRARNVSQARKNDALISRSGDRTNAPK